MWLVGREGSLLPSGELSLQGKGAKRSRNVVEGEAGATDLRASVKVVNHGCQVPGLLEQHAAETAHEGGRGWGRLVS